MFHFASQGGRARYSISSNHKFEMLIKRFDDFERKQEEAEKRKNNFLDGVAGKVVWGIILGAFAATMWLGARGAFK